MIFYLGVHRPGWLARAGVPLFLSFQTLKNRRTLSPGRWAVDSGAFTELHTHGRWTISAEQYVEQLRFLSAQAGRPDFAAVQDWMCEPFMLKRTGLAIEEHQRRTLESYVTLQRLAPEMPWAPVLQGWKVSDYLRHLAMYRAEGIDLASFPVVGIGSVCRRQATYEAAFILHTIAAHGVRLHAFGLKAQGLAATADLLHSADSMAWSFGAVKRQVQLPSHTHKNCGNCLEYALWWRQNLLANLALQGKPIRQGYLWTEEVA